MNRYDRGMALLYLLDRFDLRLSNYNIETEACLS